MAGLCDLPAMADPAAIVAYVAPLDFSAISATVPLDGSASTSGIANPALTYLWELKTKPPGSAASLSATNTATVNLLNVDTAGTYIAWLQVQNADGVWSEQVFETTPNTEPASRVYVNVKTQNLGLIPTGLWARTMQDLSAGDPGFNDEQQKVIDLFNAVDNIGGTSPSGGQQATRYVTAAAGPSTATGTISDPFNATSAAANGFDGPLDQAHNSLTTGATIAALGYTVVMYAGDYDEDFNETADRQWTFNWLGNVTFQATNDFIFIGTTGTNLIMSPLADGSTCTFGRVGIGNPIAHSWYWFARGASWASVNASGVCAAGVQANFENCFCAANFSLANLAVNYADSTTFGTGTSDFTFGIATRMTECVFSDDLTASSAATSGGFYACTFPGTPLFTGPAGSARFDGITAARFEAAGGTFAGGAGKADFLTQTFAIVNVNTTGYVATDEIRERTVANGVLVDQTLIKDTEVRATRVYTSGGNDLSLETAGIAMLFDESAQTVTVSDPFFSPNIRTLWIPIAVKPNASYFVVASEVNYQGAMVTVDFTAAVAAASAAGDITVQIFDSDDDSAITAATSIDGLTSLSITVSDPSFASGFYAEIQSSNPDATQGAGMALRMRYTISGPT